eukprot:TRINITY_DN3152_c4_g4_i1.p1 TRINITY_DN3152_c4_g4~~TRINITY_DN3152_c4_g4_i1.p1  ORF type:complete len:91 (+),score=31.02 TRINITY_DN3152_c4_g4_i1:119-391(+)
MTSLFPVCIGQKLAVMITDEVKSDETNENWLDIHSYAMNGKVFQFSKSESEDSLSVYASFGGLLMELVDSVENLTSVGLDQEIYFLCNVV